MAVDYDPLSEEAMTDPQPLYAQLRAEDPVHYMAKYDAWALASFAAVWQVCSDTSSFSVRRGPTPNQILLGEPASDLTFAGLDPPEHRLRRRVLAPFYTRESAERDDDTIRTIADGGASSRCSAKPRVSMPTATTRTSSLGDSPRPRPASRQRRRLVARADRRVVSPRGRASEEPRTPTSRPTIEVFTYLHGLVVDSRRDRTHERRAYSPTLLDAVVEGVALTDEQVAAELHTLMVTGSDTTEFGLAAALYHLARNPSNERRCSRNRGCASGHSPKRCASTIRPTFCVAPRCGRCRRRGQVDPRGSRSAAVVGIGQSRRGRVLRTPIDSTSIGATSGRCSSATGSTSASASTSGLRMGAVMLEEFITRVATFDVDFAGVGRRRGEFLKGFNRMPVEVVIRQSGETRPERPPERGQ